MNYSARLVEKTKETGSILCMGIDPVLEKIPVHGETEKRITSFYLDILEAARDEDASIPIVKPNIAFFEQYGFEGLRALKTIIEEYKKKDIDVILDAKRGDIGKTSTAYAKSIFEFWKADATTISPYLGQDSVTPFTEFCKQGKGVYMLVKTSNQGSVDFQNLSVDGKPIYMKTAEKLAEWHQPGLGAVVGATFPKELSEIASYFKTTGKSIPLLIPGVGSQGGDVSSVISILRESGSYEFARINSSSEINYAYVKQGTDDYAGAAVKEIKRLNKTFSA